MSAHQVAVQRSTTDVTPREVMVTTPAAAPYRFTDVEGNALPLLCPVEQIQIDPQRGATASRARHQGHVVGWDTTWLPVRFDDDGAVIVLRARLVRALDPWWSR